MSEVTQITEIDEIVSRMIRTLGPKFFAEARRAGRFNADFFESMFAQLLDQGLGAGLRLGEHGVLVAVLTPDMVTGDTVAMELFWYVDPDYRGIGKKLMSAFEQWARDVGANRMVMGHPLPCDQSMGQFYMRQMYMPLETHYMKEVICLKP